MIKNITIVVVVFIASVLIFAATRPDTFSVQRAASIKAPPEKIFPLINDLHGWDAWSPWEKKDPAMKRTFSGTTSGKGATYAWEGNKEVGKGSLEIIDAEPPSKIVIALHFIEPFEGRSTATFTLDPNGDATPVTWTMSGPSPYISKLIGIFINCDNMIGKDFEAGLASMKAAAEK